MKFDLTLSFGLVLLIGIFGLGYMHEQVHVEIYKSYGIESYVEYFSHFPYWVTIPEKSCPTESCELAHNINEVVGYHSFAFYLMIGVGLFFLMIIGGKDE